MKKKRNIVVSILLLAMTLCGICSCTGSKDADILKEFPQISESSQSGYFPLATTGETADIYIDEQDYRVVGIAAEMLAGDVERVSGQKANVHTGSTLSDCGQRPAIVAGTLGHSALIDQLVEQGVIAADSLKGRWE